MKDSNSLIPSPNEGVGNPLSEAEPIVVILELSRKNEDRSRALRRGSSCLRSIPTRRIQSEDSRFSRLLLIEYEPPQSLPKFPF